MLCYWRCDIGLTFLQKVGHRVHGKFINKNSFDVTHTIQALMTLHLYNPARQIATMENGNK